VSRIVGRVVVGVSGSPESLHALRHAVELARQYDAVLLAVNAQRPDGQPSHVWQHAASLVIRDAFEEGLGGLPKDVECVLLAAPGDPGPALLGVANRSNDVLVLGAAHGGGGHGGVDAGDADDGPEGAEVSGESAGSGESGGSGESAGIDAAPGSADPEPRLPARRQLLPVLWRRHVRPALEPAPVRVAAYCLGRAVCSVLSVPPPPLAAPARAFTRLPR
jgi:nucleotide-binding universal stress UspA family protein